MEHKSYVSPETAKLLKQAGFDWMCSSLYGREVRHEGVSIDEDEEYELKASGREDEIEYIDGGAVYNIYNDNNDPYCYSRPTLDVAQRWLREIKGYHIAVFPESHYDKGIVYRFSIYNEDYDGRVCYSGHSGQAETYEEAQEAGNKKALEIILEKGK